MDGLLFHHSIHKSSIISLGSLLLEEKTMKYTIL